MLKETRQLTLHDYNVVQKQREKKTEQKRAASPRESNLSEHHYSGIETSDWFVSIQVVYHYKRLCLRLFIWHLFL